MTAVRNKAGSVSRRRFLEIAAAQSAALALGGAFSRLAGSDLDPRQHVRWQGIALGAEVSIDLWSEDPSGARHALALCRREIRRLEDVFSLYDEFSAVGRLNREGQLVRAPGELRELISLCQGYSELSQGAFDITIQPLCELFQSRGAAASEREIADALRRVDYRGIDCVDEAVRLSRPGMRVTFNGVAQGYITDRVADMLEEHGFSHVLVDLGEKRALGSHPSGRPWRIGVESPETRGALVGALDLQGRALATSGGYGEVYVPGCRHHLVDARSGASRVDFSSLTVVARRAVEADALSTCLAVSPPERFGELLGRFPQVDVHVVKPGVGRLVPFHRAPAS